MRASPVFAPLANTTLPSENQLAGWLSAEPKVVSVGAPAPTPATA